MQLHHALAEMNVSFTALYTHAFTTKHQMTLQQSFRFKNNTSLSCAIHSTANNQLKHGNK